MRFPITISVAVYRLVFSVGQFSLSRPFRGVNDNGSGCSGGRSCVKAEHTEALRRTPWQQGHNHCMYLIVKI